MRAGSTAKRLVLSPRRSGAAAFRRFGAPRHQSPSGSLNLVSVELSPPTPGTIVRRLPSVLLLGALALSTTAFAPVLSSPGEQVAADSEREIVICVKFREWEVPATGVTFEPPYERFCVETRDVVIPFPGGNPMPGTLPGPEGQE